MSCKKESLIRISDVDPHHIRCRGDTQGMTLNLIHQTQPKIGLKALDSSEYTLKIRWLSLHFRSLAWAYMAQQITR